MFFNSCASLCVGAQAGKTALDYATEHCLHDVARMIEVRLRANHLLVVVSFGNAFIVCFSGLYHSFILLGAFPSLLFHLFIKPVARFRRGIVNNQSSGA